MKKKYHPEELIENFCRISGIDVNDVCSKGKNSNNRAFLMELLYRHCKITQPEIGRLSDGIDYSSVSYSRKRLRQKMEKDPEVKRRFEKLDAELTVLKR